MNPTVARHVANVIADLVRQDKEMYVRALLLSYPAGAIPFLVLSVAEALDGDEVYKPRFVAICEELAD